MDTLLESFDNRFADIDRRSRELLSKIPIADLYRKPREIAHSMAAFSCGEFLLRSAAAVEQTFGGITTRLWDDPFEWTLPEKLSTPELVIEYLNEVEATRVGAFKFFGSDDDLRKQILAPEYLRTIFDLLLETVARAEHYQGRAFALFRVMSDEKLPRL
ncbi:MAG: hypothetical protein DMF63_13680 [Acidobacteria bacterium]|nr:MAG: hypothetical protein DMF63_13680 [Acidobacteriota bacterium]